MILENKILYKISRICFKDLKVTCMKCTRCPKKVLQTKLGNLVMFSTILFLINFTVTGQITELLTFKQCCAADWFWINGQFWGLLAATVNSITWF